MLKNGTYWVPTLSAYIPATPEEDSDLQRMIVAHHKEVFQKAMKMGIKIAFGTDVGRVRAWNVRAGVRADGELWNDAAECDSVGDDDGVGAAADGEADRNRVAGEVR